jgi:hypothetical protein
MSGAFSRLVPGLRLQHLRAVLCALALLTQLAVPLLHGQHSHCEDHHACESTRDSGPAITSAAAGHEHGCQLCEELARTHWTLASAAQAVSQPALSAAAAPTPGVALVSPRTFRDALAARGPPAHLA